MDMIKKIIKAGESERVEFKSKSVRLNSILNNVCAFLNSNGGTLIIGVGNSGEIEGIPNADALRTRIADELDKSLKPNANWTVETAVVSGVELVMVKVPKGDAIPYIYNGRIYVRKGVTSRVANNSDIVTLIENRTTGDKPWESAQAIGSSFESLDVSRIKNVLSHTFEKDMPIESDRDKLYQILEGLHLVSGGILTNAAVVLFAHEPYKLYPQTAVKLIRFMDKNKGQALDTRDIYTNAFGVIEEALDFLHQNTQSFPLISAGKRSEHWSYSLFAVREALVNACIHRDYSSYGARIQVSVFDDMIEIWNPGLLPEGIKIADLSKQHASIARNPLIADSFFRAGLMERWGSGTLRMIDECKRLGTKPPLWKAISGGISVTLYAKHRNKTKDMGSGVHY
jgi:ATP-dependent DNA helicase RecG